MKGDAFMGTCVMEKISSMLRWDDRNRGLRQGGQKWKEIQDMSIF